MARYFTVRQKHDLIAAVANLTPRERQVFALVVRGRQNRQIADELACSERTVKAHRQTMMQKLNVQTLTQLVSMAERLGRST